MRILHGPEVVKTPIGYTVSVGEGTHLEAVREGTTAHNINIEDISVAPHLRERRHATRMVATLAGLAIQEGCRHLHSCWTDVAGWHLHRRIFGPANVQTVWERHQGSVMVGDVVPPPAVPDFFDDIARHEKECITTGVEPSKCLAINVDLTSIAVQRNVAGTLYGLGIDEVQMRTVEMNGQLRVVGSEIVRLDTLPV